MFSSHLTHSCTHRYFAIALLNKEGSVLKMGGTTKLQNLTVVYQIHRDGKSISSVFTVCMVTSGSIPMSCFGHISG